MRLSDLPPEILEVIASFIAGFRSRERDLAALRETCTLMASIGARHLFRALRVSQDRVKCARFCHVLVKTPALALHVQDLMLPFSELGPVKPSRTGQTLTPAFKRCMHRALRLMHNLATLFMFVEEHDVLNLVKCEFNLQTLCVAVRKCKAEQFISRQPLLHTLLYSSSWTGSTALNIDPDSLMNLHDVSGKWALVLPLVPSRPVTALQISDNIVPINDLKQFVLPSLKLSIGPLKKLDVSFPPEDFAISLLTTLQALPELRNLTTNTDVFSRNTVSLENILCAMDDDTLWQSIPVWKPELADLAIRISDATFDEGTPPTESKISSVTSRFVNCCQALQKIEYHETCYRARAGKRTSVVRISRPKGAQATWHMNTSVK